MPTSTTSLTLTQINTLSEPEFITIFGDLYEHSPWAAKGAFQQLPYNTVASMLNAFRCTVDHAPKEQQLILLKAHPELGEKKLDSLTPSSLNEQTNAGLTHVDENTKAEFKALNKAYRERHGFPFIIAVAGLNAQHILAALKERLSKPTSEEFPTALEQVHRIAGIRLNQRVATN
ncbi:Uric acid degradation bifunctional protein PucL [Halomonadaceae bacterium LMG 33818]|uniref:2-oxo-4-hydroxy-4-carboxy-5-ureidoimidazoline decarboxylase n=1 Tax=Cernens ardua TaxID=3402176 RepID=UPI003EDC683E